MNFHKTIGYLAALLLIVGFGVPDSFAQDVKTISVSVDESTIADNTNVDGNTMVTVIVTANVTLAVTVTAADVTADNNEKVISVTVPTDNDDDSYSAPSITIDVTVAVGETTGSNTGELVFTMDPTGDDADRG